MSMIYMQCDAALAGPLSEALYQLMRPPHVRDERDGSRYYCEVIEHPSGNGWAVLALPATEMVPIHVEADGEYLGQILSVFVDNKALTQEEADGIIAAVQAVAGTQVEVASFIPPSWQPYILADRAAAIAAGYIVESEG
jgi:hypothetical protein